MLTPLPSTLLPLLLLLLLLSEVVCGPRPYAQISTASTGVTPTAVDGDTTIEVSHAAVVDAVFGSVK